jgi:hypothetical protein
MPRVKRRKSVNDYAAIALLPDEAAVTTGITNPSSSSSSSTATTTISDVSEDIPSDNPAIDNFFLQSCSPKPALSRCRKTNGGGLRGGHSNTPRKGLKRNRKPDGTVDYTTRTPQKRTLNDLSVKVKLEINGQSSKLYKFAASDIPVIETDFAKKLKRIKLGDIYRNVGLPQPSDVINDVLTIAKSFSQDTVENAGIRNYL